LAEAARVRAAERARERARAELIRSRWQPIPALVDEVALAFHKASSLGDLTSDAFAHDWNGWLRAAGSAWAKFSAAAPVPQPERFLALPTTVQDYTACPVSQRQEREKNAAQYFPTARVVFEAAIRGEARPLDAARLLDVEDGFESLLAAQLRRLFGYLFRHAQAVLAKAFDDDVANNEGYTAPLYKALRLLGAFSEECRRGAAMSLDFWSPGWATGEAPSLRQVAARSERAVVEMEKADVAQPGAVGKATALTDSAPPTGEDEDLSAYRPAKEFLDLDRFPDYNAINRTLQKHPEIRWRRPRGRRKLIHAGDWMKMMTQVEAQKPFDPQDMPAAVFDAFVGNEVRKEVERKRKAGD
jgi:hypothetical protein